MDSRARSKGAVAPATSGELDQNDGVGDGVGDSVGDSVGDGVGDDGILDDVLVEDVSIDGMCGVY